MFEITKTNIAKKNQAYSKKFQLRYQILRCFSNLRARTILYIYIFCSMLFILASIIILFNLVNQQVSQILVDSSGIIFDLNSYRQQYFIMQSLVLYWIAYIHSTSQPLITMHRLHNFYQQQTSLQIGIQESEQNCYKNSFQEKICICNLDYQMIDTSKNDQMAVFKNLLQFQSILPTKIFGVESYMGFLNDKPKHIFNYPCLDYTNQSDFDPRTRPWYIEAQKAYNLSNFQQYSVRLTEHFITVLSNEIRFSIALPLINFEKSMIGAFRVLIQSKTLQEMINVWKNDTNLILTTNEGMLLVSNLFQNSGFQLGKDYFYNESITGFNFEDWQAIVKTKQSNCNNIVVGFICRQNKIDNQDYYMMHTPLGEYNLQIIIYQTKFQYKQYIQEQQLHVTTQINENLITGTIILNISAIVTSIISSIVLKIIMNPLQQIASIFRVTKYSCSQSITQRLFKFKMTNNHAGIFMRPSCFYSKEIFSFCQCIHQFITNFSTIKKKKNITYELINSIKYPKKEKDKTNFIKFFKEQMKKNNKLEPEITQAQVIKIISQSMQSSIQNEF